MSNVPPELQMSEFMLNKLSEELSYLVFCQIVILVFPLLDDIVIVCGAPSNLGEPLCS